MEHSSFFSARSHVLNNISAFHQHILCFQFQCPFKFQLTSPRTKQKAAILRCMDCRKLPPPTIILVNIFSIAPQMAFVGRSCDSHEERGSTEMNSNCRHLSERQRPLFTHQQKVRAWAIAYHVLHNNLSSFDIAYRFAFWLSLGVSVSEEGGHERSSSRF